MLFARPAGGTTTAGAVRHRKSLSLNHKPGVAAHSAVFVVSPARLKERNIKTGQ